MTRHSGDTVRLVSFPAPLRENQYQRRLYEALGERGFELADGHFKLGWLLRNRKRVRVLHFHWPQDHWRHPPRPKGPASWLKLGLFAVRLAAARALGYRIAWTIHEVYPLKTASRRLDVLGTALLVRFSNVLVTNDEATAEQARRELGRPAAKVQVVPHAAYDGDYPPGRSRSEMRAELGVAEDATLFLLFGHVSVYKQVEWYVDAFRSADLADAVLVVAGLEMDEPTGAKVRAGAAADERVKAKLEFIPDERVAELYDAADVAVCPRQDGGTSAVLILALSMGVPAIAADAPTYAALTGGERAGWLFEPYDRESLIAAMRRAAADPQGLAERRAAALDQVAGLSWDAMGARIAELLRDTLDGPAEARGGTACAPGPEAA